jgi:hypothetical protein
MTFGNASLPDTGPVEAASDLLPLKALQSRLSFDDIVR